MLWDECKKKTLLYIMWEGDGFSLLSDKIKKLFEASSEDKRQKNVPEEYIRDNIFQWDKIEKHLIAGNVNMDAENLNYENCFECCQLFAPVWQACSNTPDSILVEISQCPLWKSHCDIILDLCRNKNEQTEAIEGVLVLTSVIENVLGNICLTLTGLNPPHLLRDLLRIKKLEEYFGILPIYFMRILFGTPNSINLRNIVWHGFANPKEIPNYFYKVLIVLFNSLSAIHRTKTSGLICRKKVEHINEYFQLEEKQLQCLNSELGNKEEIHKTIELSKYCPKEYEIYWKTAYSHYLEAKYARSLILILPQIEFVFRLLFSERNNFDVSAKIDEYYITLDTIFEYKIPNRDEDNRLYSKDFTQLMKLSYDLFVSLDGPRIRDKTCHGEVNFNHIDRNVCIVILTLGFYMLGCSLCEITNFVNNYETRFHISALFRRNFKEANSKYGRLLDSLSKYDCMRELFNRESSDCEQSITTLLSNFELCIFKRHSQERIIFGYLNRIIINAKVLCENLLESYELKLKCAVEMKLRSRERKTLETMIEIFPCLHTTLHSILQSSSFLFLKIHNDEEHIWIEKYCDNIIRFLKKYLKTVENLVQTTHITKNRTDKSYQICKCFKTELVRFQNECVIIF